MTCATLRDEVGMLSELLAPIGNPQLAANFRRALLDIFLAATQVRAAAWRTKTLMLNGWGGVG